MGLVLAITTTASAYTSDALLEDETWDLTFAPPCDFDLLKDVFGVEPLDWINFDMRDTVYHPINRTLAHELLDCQKHDVPKFHLGSLWQEVHDTEHTDDGEGHDGEVHETELIEDPDRRRGALVNVRLWPGGIIPIDFSSFRGHPAVNERAVRAGINILQTYTCLRFKAKDRNDRHFIRFTQGGGCSSLLGFTGRRGGQGISLGRGCGNTGVATHELLHAIGFLHEQSRADRDNFITVMERNIIPGRGSQFSKRNTIDTKHPYDWASLMHYGPFGFNRHRGRDRQNNPSIADKTGKAAITGQRHGMSQQDVDQVNLIYKNECTNPVPRQAPTVHHPLHRFRIKCRRTGPAHRVASLNACAEAIYEDEACPISVFTYNDGTNDCRCCTDLRNGAENDSGYRIHFATGMSRAKGLGGGSVGPRPNTTRRPVTRRPVTRRPRTTRRPVTRRPRTTRRPVTRRPVTSRPTGPPVTRPRPTSGSTCCGQTCRASGDCSAGTFCCPFRKRCMDKRTKSTRGDLCCQGSCGQKLRQCRTTPKPTCPRLRCPRVRCPRPRRVIIRRPRRTVRRGRRNFRG